MFNCICWTGWRSANCVKSLGNVQIWDFVVERLYKTGYKKQNPLEPHDVNNNKDISFTADIVIAIFILTQ